VVAVFAKSNSRLRLCAESADAPKIIIITDNKSLQQELTSPLTSMQLDKIVKGTSHKM